MIELQEPQPSAQIERRDIDQIIEEPDGGVILTLDHYRKVKILHNLALPLFEDFRNSHHKQEILTIHAGIDFSLLFLNQLSIPHLLLPLA